ncbi:MAG: hypothetical protein C7B47_15915 [Sulfobacillus thermosulfidooxidans]|uniref:Uncharacterized protein n=1 Tax=Sulfobacillus thermosulfidooxidans TaxID=28034 RepID=A0A2T2WM17_SULTH|nr:MAG: hypothetical protein C7B47_15915 [Sulfobacillus thermosulfidooxidans]
MARIQEVMPNWSQTRTPLFFVKITPAHPSLIAQVRQHLGQRRHGDFPVAIHHAVDSDVLTYPIIKVFQSDGTWWLDVVRPAQMLAAVANILSTQKLRISVWFGIATENDSTFRNREGYWHRHEGVRWTGEAFAEIRDRAVAAGGWESYFANELHDLVFVPDGPIFAFASDEEPVEIGEYLHRHPPRR